MASLSALVVFAQYCWMGKSVCLSLQGSGTMDCAVRGWARVCPRQYSHTLCSLPGCARHHVLDVPFTQRVCCLTLKKVCMLVWRVGIGPHACLVLNPSAGVWPWQPCHATLHGGALVGTPVPLSRPCNLCRDLASWVGAATQGASVVGAAYSRLLRAESCIMHRLLIVGAAATIVGSPIGALGEWWV